MKRRIFIFIVFALLAHLTIYPKYNIQRLRPQRCVCLSGGTHFTALDRERPLPDGGRFFVPFVQNNIAEVIIGGEV